MSKVLPPESESPDDESIPSVPPPTEEEKQLEISNEPEKKDSPPPIHITDQLIESLPPPTTNAPHIWTDCTIQCIDWRGQDISTPISFINCTFHQKFDISQAHFYQYLIFKGGTLHCQLQADYCTFHYKTNVDSLNNPQSKEEVNSIIHPDLGFIDEVTFVQGASFSHCQFHGQVDFSQANFESNKSNCSFNHSTFHYPFTRITTTKHIHVPQFIRMLGIRFGRDLHFSNVEVHSGLDLYESEVQGTADFSHSVFHAPTFLNYTTFHKNSTFSRALFKSYFSCHNAHFHKALIWENTIFQQRVKSDYLTVNGRFNATDCHFFMDNHPNTTSEPAFYKIIFSNSRFGNVVDFRGSIFGGIVHFRRARFEEEVRLQKTEFCYYTSFENARFDDTLIIRDIAPLLGKNASLHFNGARLEKISADHNELEQFLHCLFADLFLKHLESSFKDKKYYHSINLISQKDFDSAQQELENTEDTRLQESTHTLAEFNKSFHDSFNNKGEDWCYVQQKKLQRKNLTQRPILWMGNWLLDITCSYGTSPYRVSMTAFFFLFFFTAIYLCIPHSFNPSGALPEIYLSADRTQLQAVPFGEALTLSFQVLTSSEVVPHIEPKQHINWLIMLESFIGYMVMMLLVITLSRRVIRS